MPRASGDSDSSSSSSVFSLPDLDPASILATYHCVWKDATGEGNDVCDEGMIQIVAANTSTTTNPANPAQAPGDDENQCVAYFTYGVWSCAFACVHDPPSNTFSEFIFREMNKAMKESVDDRNPELEMLDERDENGHAFLKFYADCGYSGCVDVDVELWAKRGDGVSGREELTKGEIRNLGLRDDEDEETEEEVEGKKEEKDDDV